MKSSPQFVSFTDKALRIQDLRSGGMSFDEALAIADSEYTSDGMSLKNVGPCNDAQTFAMEPRSHL
jgi:hypothetical protein